MKRNPDRVGPIGLLDHRLKSGGVYESVSF
jgi:hypothetical protein